MKRKDYIENLVDEIKGYIATDTDIKALNECLGEMLELDSKRAMALWKEIINNDDFLKLHENVDYSPLFNGFLVKLLDYFGFDSIIWFVSKMHPENKRVAYLYIYNTSDTSSFINQSVYRLIIRHLSREEKNFLKLIKDRSIFYPKEVFNLTKLLENVINWHYEEDTVNIKSLLLLTEYPSTRKEQAILKAHLLKDTKI